MMLKDKIVIVTGATRGIGLAIAETFAAQGGKIVVCATKSETCLRVAGEIGQQYSVETLGYALDVADLTQVQAMIEAVMQKFGRIDVLVNNAGVTKDNLLLRMSLEEWQTVININLNSVFNCTKSVVRQMLKQKYGRIINITSVVGLMGNSGQANYAASKAGVIGFTKTVAKEFGAKGITCNAVAPGFIATDMIKSLPKEYLDNIIALVPQKRIGQPQDIAQAALFLASDMASYITGQVLQVDGGMLV